MNSPLKIIKDIPQTGQGSFWENRVDRRHCGIDLYSEKDAEVFSITNGEVLAIELMTCPEYIHYWNVTYQIIIKENGFFVKYGEVVNPQVKVGDAIKEGDLLALVGQVLDATKITEKDPLYVQKLKLGKNAMLHLECWKADPIIVHKKYLGGNWFGEDKPENLINPQFLLK